MRVISGSKLAKLSLIFHGNELAVIARERLYKAGCLYVGTTDRMLDNEPMALAIDHVFTAQPTFVTDPYPRVGGGAWCTLALAADTRVLLFECDKDIMLYTGVHIAPPSSMQDRLTEQAAWGAYQFLFVDRLVWVTWPLILYLKKL